MASESEASRGGRTLLMRHPSDRIIGGVCGGVADYTGASLNFVRVVALILFILPAAGMGLGLYVLLWLFLPQGTQAGGQTAPPIVQSRARRKSS